MDNYDIYVIAVWLTGFLVGGAIATYIIGVLKTDDLLWLTGKQPLQPLATSLTIIDWQEPNEEMYKTTKGMNGSDE